MKYQLWNMISYSHYEPMVPFTLLLECDNFEEIYYEFIKKNTQKIPCVIILNEKKNNL